MHTHANRSTYDDLTIRLCSRSDRNYKRNDSQRIILYSFCFPIQAMTKCWLNVKCLKFCVVSRDSFPHSTLEQLISFLFQSVLRIGMAWRYIETTNRDANSVRIVYFDEQRSRCVNTPMNICMCCVYMCVKIWMMTLELERSIRFHPHDLNCSWERFDGNFL